MTPPHPRVAELLAELEAVADVLAAARRSLAEGALLDLAGLEDRIADLCAALVKLPHADAGGFSEPMTMLVSEFDALVVALKSQRLEFGDSDESDDDPTRAARAYGQKPPPKPPPKPPTGKS